MDIFVGIFTHVHKGSGDVVTIFGLFYVAFNLIVDIVGSLCPAFVFQHMMTSVLLVTST